MAFEDLRIEMKCKDFHTEVEEGLKGESLSIAAQDHAAGCRPCHDFNQKHVEFREWLTVCRKVTAPKDFQFGVQKKIANAGASHGWAWSRLRYIVPATALAAIAVLAGSYLLNPPNQPNTSPVATISNSTQNLPVAKNEGSLPAPSANETAIQPAESGGQPGEEKIASAANKQDNNSRMAMPKERTDPGGGSKDLGANVPKEPEFPQGVNPLRNKAADQSTTQNTLSSRGVITNMQMKVIFVKPNSPGLRGGVLKGDVVEKLSGNVLTVKRGEETVQIILK